MGVTAGSGSRFVLFYKIIKYQNSYLVRRDREP